MLRRTNVTWTGRDENISANGRRPVENLSSQRRTPDYLSSGRCRPVDYLSSGRRRLLDSQGAMKTAVFERSTSTSRKA